MKHALYAGLRLCAAPLFSGIGSILMFHRIVDRREAGRIANTDCETPREDFERVIHYLRDKGYDLITLDELYLRLLDPSRSQRPFACITFDDGYADNYQVAFPICRELGVPFTVYVVPHFIDGKAPIWWYLLEDHCLANSSVRVDHGGITQHWVTDTIAEKRAAYESIDGMFRRADTAGRVQLAEQLFGRETIDATARRLMMSWDQLRELDASGLVTVGAHTCTHPVMSRLSQREAHWEIVASGVEIASRLNKPVHHFAFPYGGISEAAEREFLLVRAAGYKTATTTRSANIFPAHRDHLHALPRIYARNHGIDEFEMLLSGALPALRFRGRRVITA